MSLVTTCAHCGTSFSITQAQLNARSGQVRCGRCSKVFDAYDRLTSSDGSTLPARPIAEPPPDPKPIEPAQVTIVQPISTKPSVLPASDPAMLIDPFVDEKPARRKKSALRYQRMPDGSVAELKRKTSAVVLALGALFLIGALAFQVLYYFRDAIAAHYPPARPALEALCAVAQCEIGFLKKPDLLSIEASSLEADPRASQVVVLRATLRNRAPFPQAFPALELTLTDIKDQPVARRVFMPNEYRVRGPQSGGIEANAELMVQIRLQLVDIKAQGYRLYLFYPRQ